MTDGETTFDRLTEIARASRTDEGVTRLPWTGEHRIALDHITAWMHDAGLETSLDAAGTLIGSSPNPDGKPVLLIGSHQDSVPSGGRFDGIMGIAIGCLAARALRDRIAGFPFAVQVLAFADEEGVRFPTALVGPRALAGTLDPRALDMTDDTGTTMRDAMAAFGVDAKRALGIARDPASVVGYLECHIEQGPVLETRNLPVGAVSAICGISRFDVAVSGATGHAGTVPMEGRQDALVTAARLITLVSDEARAAGVRATVGTLSVKPGAVNAIPADVRFTFEIRAADDDTRQAFETDMVQRFADIGATDGCRVTATRTYDQRATLCDPALTGAIKRSIDDCGHEALTIPSGATHDASAMADLCPVAMLFVRCRGGISHRPDEHASAADIETAIRVMERTILRLVGNS